MSRNNKNATRLVKAREIAKLHQNGEKGPARTTPAHGKRWTYRNNPETAKRHAEMLKATSTEKTSAKRILEGAGKASKAVEE